MLVLRPQPNSPPYTTKIANSFKFLINFKGKAIKVVVNAYLDRYVIIFSENSIRTCLCLTVRYPPPSLIEFFINDKPRAMREVARLRRLPSSGRNLLGPLRNLRLHRRGWSRYRFVCRRWRCHHLGGWLDHVSLAIFSRGVLWSEATGTLVDIWK